MTSPSTLTVEERRVRIDNVILENQKRQYSRFRKRHTLSEVNPTHQQWRQQYADRLLVVQVQSQLVHNSDSLLGDRVLKLAVQGNHSIWRGPALSRQIFAVR